MSDIATLSIRVDTLEARQAQRDLDQLRDRGAKLEKGMDGLSRTAAHLGAALAAAFSVQKIMAETNKAITAFANFERQMLRLDAQIIATGRAGQTTADQLEAMAQRIDKATMQSAEGVRQAQAVLMSFRNIGTESMERVLMVAADVAEVMGGDIVSASRQMAIALEDPTRGLGMLRRTGTTFTAAQEELIKSLHETGRAAESQSEILKVMEQQYGGTAKRAAEGLAGAQDNLARVTNNLRIAIGEQLAPSVDLATDATAGWIERNEEMIALGIGDIVTGIGVAFAGIKMPIDAAIEAIKALIEEANRLTDGQFIKVLTLALQRVMPGGAIIGFFRDLGAAQREAGEAANEFREKIDRSSGTGGGGVTGATKEFEKALADAQSWLNELTMSTEQLQKLKEEERLRELVKILGATHPLYQQLNAALQEQAEILAYAEAAGQKYAHVQDRWMQKGREATDAQKKQAAEEKRIYGERLKIAEEHAKRREQVEAGYYDFVRGQIAEQLTDYQTHDQRTLKMWEEQWDAVQEFASDAFTAIGDVTKTFLHDFMRGELRSFEDYWKSFLNSLLRSFINFLGDLVAAWMKNQALNLLAGTSLGQSLGLSAVGSAAGGPLLGAGGSLLGSAAGALGLKQLAVALGWTPALQSVALSSGAWVGTATGAGLGSPLGAGYAGAYLTGGGAASGVVANTAATGQTAGALAGGGAGIGTLGTIAAMAAPIAMVGILDSLFTDKTPASGASMRGSISGGMSGIEAFGPRGEMYAQQVQEAWLHVYAEMVRMSEDYGARVLDAQMIILQNAVLVFDEAGRAVWTTADLAAEAAKRMMVDGQNAFQVQEALRNEAKRSQMELMSFAHRMQDMGHSVLEVQPWMTTFNDVLGLTVLAFDEAGRAVAHRMQDMGHSVQAVQPWMATYNDVLGRTAQSAESATAAVSSFSGRLAGMRFPSIPSYASGTPYHPGGMAWVGELGPELVALPRGSRVHTADESRRMARGSNDREMTSILVAVAENTRRTRTLLEEIRHAGIPMKTAARVQ